MPHRIGLRLLTAAVTIAMLLGLAAPARADLTAFWGFSPTVATRSSQGFSIDVTKAIVGGEFEWANINEKKADLAPGLKTYVFNGMLVTPGRKVQFYLVAGWGRYRETLNTVERTGDMTNLGVGLKYRLLGPVKLRLDYRVFSLHGSPVVKTPKRFYAGITLGF